MGKIPTAEEFLRKSSVTSSDKHDFLSKQELMIGFAKIHVKETLKKASEKAKVDIIPMLEIYNINREEILGAYSLDNIK